MPPPSGGRRRRRSARRPAPPLPTAGRLARVPARRIPHLPAHVAREPSRSRRYLHLRRVMPAATRLRRVARGPPTGPPLAPHHRPRPASRRRSRLIAPPQTPVRPAARHPAARHPAARSGTVGHRKDNRPLFRALDPSDRLFALFPHFQCPVSRGLCDSTSVRSSRAGEPLFLTFSPRRISLN